MIRKIFDWQTMLVENLMTVLSPEAFDQRRPERVRVFKYEHALLRGQEKALEGRMDEVKALIESCAGLVRAVMHLADVKKDDQGLAIFAFTIVTIVFLPLSFMASYFSMNGGPSTENWAETQALFWKVAAPLTAGLGLLCFGFAYRIMASQRSATALGLSSDAASSRVQSSLKSSSSQSGAVA